MQISYFNICSSVESNDGIFLTLHFFCEMLANPHHNLDSISDNCISDHEC